MAIATIIKQSAPGATTEDDLYTVPGATRATCSSIVVCNRGATDATFRLYVAIAGAAATNAQYLYYDLAIQANDTFTATLGFAMATTDVFRVFASNASLSFNLFVLETT